MLILSFPLLFFVSAPYGKLKQSTWTFDVDPRLGWFIMEAPAWITYLAITFTALPQVLTRFQQSYETYSIPDPSTGSTILPPQLNLYMVVFFVSAILYNGHYIYRSSIYPFLTHSSKSMDLVPVLCASVFNFSNGLIQSYNILCTQPKDLNSMSFLYFTFGLVGFMLAWFGCFYSDSYLISLRQHRKGTQYVIPTAGLFQFTYSANYLCEFIQWVCFAVLTQNSYSGWLFVFLTFSNLYPRAVKYRQFYLQMAKEKESASIQAI